MAGVIMVPGSDMMLRQLVNKPPPASANKTLRLFTNNITPAAGDAVGSYTECTDGSYAGIALTGASWTMGTVANGASASYASQTFTFAGANSLYGWYLTDAANSVVYAAERFSGAPLVVPAGGGTLGVSVELEDASP